MDPVEMVKHYHDPIASAAAEAMKPKKYLVFLDMGLDLPTPSNPWFKFCVNPIATTLRDEEPEKGITSDMVIPIFPNTQDPGDHGAPIRTHPTFPFPNCYHWIEAEIDVRIRRQAKRYDDSAATRVDVLQHAEIDEAFHNDYLRISEFNRAKREAADAEAARFNRPEEPILSEETRNDGPERVPLDETDSLPVGPDDLGEPGCYDSPSASACDCEGRRGSRDSIAEILQLDFFGFTVDDTVELMPLVNLWFELTDHLTAETIPSPAELYEERETIMRIIHDARERASSVRLPLVDSGISIHDDAASVASKTSMREVFDREFRLAPRELREKYGIFIDDAPSPRPQSSRPRPEPKLVPPPEPKPGGFWLGARRKARGLFEVLIPWATRPLCLPFWP